MNLRWKFCLTVGVLSVAGSVQAVTPDAAADRSVASRSAAVLVDAGRAKLPAGAGAPRLPAGADDPGAHGSQAGIAPATLVAGLSNPPDPASLQRSVVAGTGPLPLTALRRNPVGDEAPALVLAQLSSADPLSTPGAGDRAAFLFSADDLPEPAGWMTLVCGLLIGAFMVRRKHGQTAD